MARPAGNFPTTPYLVHRSLILMVVVGQLFARLADGRLGKDVQKNLPRLFAEHSALLVDNDKSEYSEPRSFDYAVATVQTPGLHLRFVRVRGEFSIDVAVPDEQRKWESLDSALLWLDIQPGTSGKTKLPDWGYGSDWHSLDWWTIDGFLAENWERITAAAKR